MRNTKAIAILSICMVPLCKNGPDWFLHTAIKFDQRSFYKIPEFFLQNVKFVLQNTDHIFLFLTPPTDPKAGILVPLGKNFGIIFGSWEEFFWDYCQGRAPPIETFSSEVRHSKVKEDLLHSVSERISSALIIQKGKVTKIKGASRSWYKTNEHKERSSNWDRSWIILTCWNFLLLHVDSSFAMWQFINGISTLKCYSLEAS